MNQCFVKDCHSGDKTLFSPQSQNPTVIERWVKSLPSRERPFDPENDQVCRCHFPLEAMEEKDAFILRGGEMITVRKWCLLPDTFPSIFHIDLIHDQDDLDDDDISQTRENENSLKDGDSNHYNGTVSDQISNHQQQYQQKSELVIVSVESTKDTSSQSKSQSDKNSDRDNNEFETQALHLQSQYLQTPTPIPPDLDLDLDFDLDVQEGVVDVETLLPGNAISPVSKSTSKLNSKNSIPLQDEDEDTNEGFSILPSSSSYVPRPLPIKIEEKDGDDLRLEEKISRPRPLQVHAKKGENFVAKKSYTPLSSHSLKAKAKTKEQAEVRSRPISQSPKKKQGRKKGWRKKSKDDQHLLDIDSHVQVSPSPPPPILLAVVIKSGSQPRSLSPHPHSLTPPLPILHPEVQMETDDDDGDANRVITQDETSAEENTPTKILSRKKLPAKITIPFAFQNLLDKNKKRKQSADSNYTEENKTDPQVDPNHDVHPPNSKIVLGRPKIHRPVGWKRKILKVKSKIKAKATTKSNKSQVEKSSSIQKHKQNKAKAIPEDEENEEGNGNPRTSSKTTDRLNSRFKISLPLRSMSIPERSQSESRSNTNSSNAKTKKKGKGKRSQSSHLISESRPPVEIQSEPQAKPKPIVKNRVYLKLETKNKSILQESKTSLPQSVSPLNRGRGRPKNVSKRRKKVKRLSPLSSKAKRRMILLKSKIKKQDSNQLIQSPVKGKDKTETSGKSTNISNIKVKKNLKKREKDIQNQLKLHPQPQVNVEILSMEEIESLRIAIKSKSKSAGQNSGSKNINSKGSLKNHDEDSIDLSTSDIPTPSKHKGKIRMTESEPGSESDTEPETTKHLEPKGKVKSKTKTKSSVLKEKVAEVPAKTMLSESKLNSKSGSLKYNSLKQSQTEKKTLLEEDSDSENNISANSAPVSEAEAESESEPDPVPVPTTSEKMKGKRGRPKKFKRGMKLKPVQNPDAVVDKITAPLSVPDSVAETVPENEDKTPQKKPRGRPKKIVSAETPGIENVRDISPKSNNVSTSGSTPVSVSNPPSRKSKNPTPVENDERNRENQKPEKDEDNKMCSPNSRKRKIMEEDEDDEAQNQNLESEPEDHSPSSALEDPKNYGLNTRLSASPRPGLLGNATKPRCFVLSCLHQSPKLFHAPLEDSSLFKEWLKLIPKRERPFTSDDKICAEHFPIEMLKTTMVTPRGKRVQLGCYRWKLVPEAVPCLFRVATLKLAPMVMNDHNEVFVSDVRSSGSNKYQGHGQVTARRASKVKENNTLVENLSCVVPGCEGIQDKNAKNRKLTFHKFPFAANFKQLWVREISRKTGFSIPLTEEFLEEKLVCGLHFLAADYEGNVRSSPLRMTAVPSLFSSVSSENTDANKYKSPQKISRMSPSKSSPREKSKSKSTLGNEIQKPSQQKDQSQTRGGVDFDYDSEIGNGIQPAIVVPEPSKSNRRSRRKQDLTSLAATLIPLPSVDSGNVNELNNNITGKDDKKNAYRPGPRSSKGKGKNKRSKRNRSINLETMASVEAASNFLEQLRISQGSDSPSNPNSETQIPIPSPVEVYDDDGDDIDVGHDDYDPVASDHENDLTSQLGSSSKTNRIHHTQTRNNVTPNHSIRTVMVNSSTSPIKTTGTENSNPSMDPMADLDLDRPAITINPNIFEDLITIQDDVDSIEEQNQNQHQNFRGISLQQQQQQQNQQSFFPNLVPDQMQNPSNPVLTLQQPGIVLGGADPNPARTIMIPRYVNLNGTNMLVFEPMQLPPSISITAATADAPQSGITNSQLPPGSNGMCNPNHGIVSTSHDQNYRTQGVGSQQEAVQASAPSTSVPIPASAVASTSAPAPIPVQVPTQPLVPVPVTVQRSPVKASRVTKTTTSERHILFQMRSEANSAPEPDPAPAPTSVPASQHPEAGGTGGIIPSTQTKLFRIDPNEGKYLISRKNGKTLVTPYDVANIPSGIIKETVVTPNQGKIVFPSPQEGETILVVVPNNKPSNVTVEDTNNVTSASSNVGQSSVQGKRQSTSNKNVVPAKKSLTTNLNPKDSEVIAISSDEEDVNTSQVANAGAIVNGISTSISTPGPSTPSVAVCPPSKAIAAPQNQNQNVPPRKSRLIEAPGSLFLEEGGSNSLEKMYRWKQILKLPSQDSWTMQMLTETSRLKAKGQKENQKYIFIAETAVQDSTLVFLRVLKIKEDLKFEIFVKGLEFTSMFNEDNEKIQSFRSLQELVTNLSAFVVCIGQKGYEKVTAGSISTGKKVGDMWFSHKCEMLCLDNNVCAACLALFSGARGFVNNKSSSNSNITSVPNQAQPKQQRSRQKQYQGVTITPVPAAPNSNTNQNQGKGQSQCTISIVPQSGQISSSPQVYLSHPAAAAKVRGQIQGQQSPLIGSSSSSIVRPSSTSGPIAASGLTPNNARPRMTVRAPVTIVRPTIPNGQVQPPTLPLQPQGPVQTQKVASIVRQVTAKVSEVRSSVAKNVGMSTAGTWTVPTSASTNSSLDNAVTSENGMLPQNQSQKGMVQKSTTMVSTVSTTSTQNSNNQEIHQQQKNQNVGVTTTAVTIPTTGNLNLPPSNQSPKPSPELPSNFSFSYLDPFNNINLS